MYKRQHVVTGFDFHFGKDRQGGPAFLMASGQRHGFGVTLVDAFRDEAAEVISSSRIRARVPVGKRLTFDALATGMWPLTDGLKLDSDLTLNYRLSTELFLRLGWSANNLVVPVKGAGDWDLTTRLSLLYKR